jgi:pimeloyl-ACP methyl ester carboxylesterase
MMTPDSDGVHGIANTARSDRFADIVFVHGLGGGSHSTWRHGKEGEPGHFFWPQELGEDLPEYGIWSVGYPAGITVFGEPGMLIETRAGNIAQKLANAGLGDRPLLIVTHSMGGLIVESLIVDAEQLPGADRKRLVAQIRGIVLCGTPHRGSAAADAAGVLSRFFGGTQDHVKQMRANEVLLDLLNDKFREWHRKHPITIASYAENRALLRARTLLPPLSLGLVVPRASANPGTVGQTIADVDCDHITLVKPKKRTDDVYAGVLRFIHSVDLTGSSPQLGDVSRLAPAPPPPPVRRSAKANVAVGRPRVYVSYTLRTPDLRQRVFDLAERLRDIGIDSRIDLYFSKSLHGFIPPDPLPNRDAWEAWQEREIQKADCVLVVCSKEFIESPPGSGAWRDVDFMGKDVESGRAPLRKFIPCGFGEYETNAPFIPSFIRGANYYDLSSGTNTGFDDLVRRFRTEFPPEGAWVPSDRSPDTQSRTTAMDEADASRPESRTGAIPPSEPEKRSWEKIGGRIFTGVFALAIAILAIHGALFSPLIEVTASDFDWAPQSPKVGEVVNVSGKYSIAYRVRHGLRWERDEIPGKKLAQTFFETWSVDGQETMKEEPRTVTTGETLEAQFSTTFPRAGSYEVRFWVRSNSSNSEESKKKIVRRTIVVRAPN